MSEEALVNKIAPYIVRGPPVYGDQAISFVVSSFNWSPREWPARLRRLNFTFDYDAPSIICAEGFEPSSDVMTEVVILPCWLFKDEDRTLPVICDTARWRGLTHMNREAVCLMNERLRTTYSNLSEIGLRGILWMHKPVLDGLGRPRLLYSYSHKREDWDWKPRSSDDWDWKLESQLPIDSHRWHRMIGIAFQTIRSHVGPSL